MADISKVMTASDQRATLDLHLETPAAPRATPKTQWEKQNEQARITFHRTIDGHYRHGSTGYETVACLFLTWKDDDLQCKETEVDSLRETFEDKFQFKTDYFEIPSERWQTALHRKVSDFLYHYDSSDCLVIIYYGGHGYVGHETGQFKLSAKFEPDGEGDPKVFFNDVLSCLRLPACDQLLILDCCYAARAFHRHDVGKRKHELLVSGGFQDLVPVPGDIGSFTKRLNQALSDLLESNPNGFSTSQLYREVFHAVPDEKIARPLLFDQARHSYEKIWLRPQKEIQEPPRRGADEARTQLKLTLELNEPPDSARMHKLANALSYLPHVEKIRLEQLHAPRRELEGFMRVVMQAQKLRPLMRKLYTKRMLEKAKADHGKFSPKLVDVLLRQNHLHYDWSSAVTDEATASKPPNHHRRKSLSWPLVWREHVTTRKSLYSSLGSLDFKLDLPSGGLLSIFRSRHVNTSDQSQRSYHTHAGEDNPPPIQTALLPLVALAGVSNTSSSSRPCARYIHRDETWHIIMWFATAFGLGSLCWVMKE